MGSPLLKLKKPKVLIGPAGAERELTELELLGDAISIGRRYIDVEGASADRTLRYISEECVISFKCGHSFAQVFEEGQQFAIRFEYVKDSKTQIQHYRYATLMGQYGLELGGQTFVMTYQAQLSLRLGELLPSGYKLGHNALICQDKSFDADPNCPCFVAATSGFMS